MDFELSKHALEQMLERLISEEVVDAVLSDPYRMPATPRGTRYDGYVPDGRTLTVIVDEFAVPTKVVTVWWTQEGR